MRSKVLLLFERIKTLIVHLRFEFAIFKIRGNHYYDLLETILIKGLLKNT